MSPIEQKLLSLPADLQQEALDFIEFLLERRSSTGKNSNRSLKGIWKETGLARIKGIEKKVALVRREMTASLERELD